MCPRTSEQVHLMKIYRRFLEARCPRRTLEGGVCLWGTDFRAWAQDPGIPAPGGCGELQSHWDRPQGVAKASPELGAAGPRDSWGSDTHLAAVRVVG